MFWRAAVRQYREALALVRAGDLRSAVMYLAMGAENHGRAVAPATLVDAYRSGLTAKRARRLLDALFNLGARTRARVLADVPERPRREAFHEGTALR